MPGRRFLFAFLATAALSLSLIAGINYSIDVNRVYHHDLDTADFNQRYVKALLTSANGLVSPPDELGVKIAFSAAAEADCFVTGSSRAYPFAVEHLQAFGAPCNRVANLSVGGSGFEEFVLTAAPLLDKSGGNLFIIIDPWDVRRGASALHTQYMYGYREARKRFGLANLGSIGGFERAENLLNSRYLGQNLRAVLTGRSDPAIIPVDADGEAPSELDGVMATDGRRFLSKKARLAPPPPDAQIADGGRLILKPYIDPQVAQEWDHIATVLEAHGFRLSFILAPYHPKVLRCANAQVCAALTTVECWVRAFAARHGGRVIGSYDPRPFGLGAEHFSDDIHMVVAAAAALHALDVRPGYGNAAACR